MERQMAIVPQKADKSADQPNKAISYRNAPKSASNKKADYYHI
jgi:hypothetical protein